MFYVINKIYESFDSYVGDIIEINDDIEVDVAKEIIKNTYEILVEMSVKEWHELEELEQQFEKENPFPEDLSDAVLDAWYKKQQEYIDDNYPARQNIDFIELLSKEIPGVKHIKFQNVFLLSLDDELRNKGCNV